MKVARGWIAVYVYTLGIFAATPFLPLVIRAASSVWSSSSVSRFVLGVETTLALTAVILAAKFLVQRKKKSAIFLVSLMSIVLLSFIVYRFIPNPYEFTHFPEYAVLSLLMIRALDKEKRNSPEEIQATKKNKQKNTKSLVLKNSYILSASATGIIGTADEIYQCFLPNRVFAWYDILLNILGGIIGLLLYWGTRR